MWSHSIVRHCPPRMLCRRWLRKPDIPGIPCELTVFQRLNDRVAVANLRARRIYKIGPALHALQNAFIEKAFGGWIERRIDGNDVAHLYHLFRGRVIGETELTLNLFRKLMARSVVQLDIEWLQSSQYSQSDSACRNRTNVHSFEVVGT